MTRAELGQQVAREIAERGADRQWIASLLDRAIEVGHWEMRERVKRVYRKSLTDIEHADDWVELLDMACHLPVIKVKL